MPQQNKNCYPNREEGDGKVELDHMLISNEEREESAKDLEELIRMKGEWITRNILEEGEKGKENEEKSNTASDYSEREEKQKCRD